jgi:hypothetical protein
MHLLVPANKQPGKYPSQSESYAAVIVVSSQLLLLHAAVAIATSSFVQ